MIVEGFNNFVNEIKENQQLRLSGKTIGVPYKFHRLNKELGGIQKGQVIQLTANSGIGKSKLSRFLFVYSIYAHYLQTGYPVRILYFPLEDSLKKVIASMVSYRLLEKYKIRIAPKDLKSNRMAVSNDIIAKVEECYDYFSQLEDVMDVYDSFTAPSEIRNICLREAERYGEIGFDNSGRVIGYNQVIPMHVFCVIDNYVNLSQESGRDEHKTIGYMSKQVVRLELTKHLDFTVVGIVQQEAAKEKFNVKQDGEIVVSKLLPALEGYGNNKEVARDAHLVFGLFNPSRYKLPRFPVDTSKEYSYDTGKLGNYFRSLHVIKNNDGLSEFWVPLFFDGCTEYYQEMPQITDAYGIQKMNAYIESLDQEQSQSPILFN